ncbi:MAG: hypothetical protein KatS3mg105_4127 [Gemmatales bacterium]|nr:MAG: hypothetical protein KatS3mg105_4127 [Gemmatales bacterium]
MSETHPATIATFLLYIVGVFILAAISHKILAKKSFMGEYFLGSRGLGSWALAFTFAATSASGGSFTGFPALIYTHGWILALWIASYMVVPICTMGVMGKRLNNVARKTGAITIPDVLRDRFESTALGLFATSTIIFFTVCNLVAQFKAGAIAVETILNLPPSWKTVGDWISLPSAFDSISNQTVAYLVGLVIFAAVVVIYTAYGGFRAVVWTDVMQGVIMGLGVVILLPIILNRAGGLEEVNRKIQNHPPLIVTSVPQTNNDLAFLRKSRSRGEGIPDGVEYVIPEPGSKPSVALVQHGQKTYIQVRLGTNRDGEPVTTAEEIKKLVTRDPLVGPLLAGVEANEEGVQYAYNNDGTGVVVLPAGKKSQRWDFIVGDEFLFGPGRKADGTPFHPLGMAISFFFMWAISGMGQPGTMVRLIAFKESRTLKRAILTVTIYFGLIYLSLVMIFVAARTLLPYLAIPEDADKSMALVATRVVGDMGIGYAMLAAIFIAAPFAAIMSTVDSFLLMISSSFVRDIYQRTINPDVSERAVKYGSYATTTLVGVIVTLLATQRIDFLQYIIVFTGGGFAATFLCPVFLGIYWKGMTRQGALASMVGGFSIVVGMFAPTMLGGSRIDLFGLHPIFWGLFGSLMLGIVVSKLTGPPPEHLVVRYFYQLKADADGS